MSTPGLARGDLRGPTRGSAHLRDRLRYLTRVDEGAGGPGNGAAPGVDLHGLDERTAALARLAALVALRAAPVSYGRSVELALAGGATIDEVVATLKVVAHIVGLARVVSAAPELALALGYDIDDALETLDDPARDPDSSRPGDGGGAVTKSYGADGPFPRRPR